MIIQKFLDYNQKWASKQSTENPEYFDLLSEGQKPQALLIGCSDSRVSPSVVIGAELGEVFIHRNIANVVAHSDLNFLSVLQYAVEVLGVEHLIVYGHYGCGGVKAAITDQNYGLIDNWLAHIKDIIRLNQNELRLIHDEGEHFDRVVELNVLEQVKNLKLSSVYRKAIQNGQQLQVHAWVYDFSNGKVKVLLDDEGNEKTQPEF
jgi:carbonic anhydrase